MKFVAIFKTKKYIENWVEKFSIDTRNETLRFSAA